MLTKEARKELITKFGGSEKNSGAPEVQIALLTSRINHLAGHFEKHKLDHSSKRGLMKLIGQRRSLLKYLALNNESKYQFVLKELGLRK